MNPDSATREQIAGALRRSAGLEQGGAEATLEQLKGLNEKFIREACAGY
jgi:hypothetical protein